MSYVTDHPELSSRGRRRSFVGLLIGLWAWSMPLPVAAQSAPAVALLPATVGAETRAQERQIYRDALVDLRTNKLSEFRRKRRALAGYLLAPYLDYHFHNHRIDHLSSDEANRFRATYAEFPFADVLYRRWLLRLPGQGRWSDYLANYDGGGSALRQCYYLRALYRSGQRTAALEQVAPLWLHHRSQPKGCDPLFKVWMSAGYLTDELVWQRTVAALDHNEVTLARYLMRLQKNPDLQQASTMLYRAHVRPKTQFDPAALRQDTAINRTILRHGLLRLARKDPLRATTLWQSLRNQHQFDATDQARIEARLLLKSAEENIYPPADQRPAEVDARILVRVAREAVRAQNWAEVAYWIDRLPEALRKQPEWQYWRSYSHRDHTANGLSGLAQTRNYYGFLAAERTGNETQLNHQPAAIAEEQILAVAQLPAIARALELYAVEDLLNARREWRVGFAGLKPEQQAAGAQLAQQHSWFDQAIMAANAAELHNDLDLRFPRAFDQHYGSASKQTNLHLSTLLAVTRQESAFQRRARSSANARGLMQLLPETARRTARKAGLRTPSTSDLYEPAVNIRIASEYLADLMDRYNQQRPLAFAAYNAGEHRVDRWIKDRQGMPMEVWIETIPFKETRGYVKSVLAFNHLYSKRMNDPLPLLGPHEQTVH